MTQWRAEQPGARKGKVDIRGGGAGEFGEYTLYSLGCLVSIVKDP